jgi:hypothetical protein
MGRRGNATGVHVHTQLEVYENGRWVQYDVARFMPAGSLKLGDYSYPGLGYAPYTTLHGGDLVYDGRIYPIRPIEINAGVNVRTLADVKSAAIAQTTTSTPATQLNEIPGGAYEVGGVAGTFWAKVKLASGQIGYVAKPLIKAA